ESPQIPAVQCPRCDECRLRAGGWSQLRDCAPVAAPAPPAVTPRYIEVIYEAIPQGVLLLRKEPMCNSHPRKSVRIDSIALCECQESKDYAALRTSPGSRRAR